MPAITQQIADFSVKLRYEDLPDEVVFQVKRFLLDSIGCAFGGWDTEDVQIQMDLHRNMAGKEEAIVMVGGTRMPMNHAALMNSLLIRALDYNDIYWEEDPSHPSDIIPAALSPADALSRSGRDVITAIALAYEFEQRMCEFAHPGIRERKWHHATLTGFVSPIVAGKILDLTVDQMVQAIGISGSHCCTLGAVTAGKLTNMKNTVDPMAVQSGVLAAQLAKAGYSGPEHVIDGKEGLVDTFGPEFELELMTRDLGKDWRILRCSMKAFAAEALTHSPITAVLKIVRDNQLKPEDIAEIRVKTVARAADILSDPSKYKPTSKETADHSLPYCLAAAVVDDMVTPAQFKDEKLKDPRIWSLLPKIKVEAEPEFEKLFPRLKATEVSITTTRNNKHTVRVDYPKGDYRDPMTEEELLDKFDSMVLDKTGQKKRDEMVDRTMNLEKEKDICEFMQKMTK
ncbi:MAG: MmgE/PrpD family protein [Calditrichaeota bacterium]|nr:MmgE/PrpD family protein [Calditrichota bacterium]RQW04098.1 MAG: MmgE/PrpD family protein [Calditrichota bacterium]